MSITSAMYTGVSGLLANAEGINVIGNNLANVNTVGFKDSRMLFSDVLSTSIGNNSQIGHGVQIQKVDNVFSQGSTETSTNVTDLMIQGNGFFALGGPSAPAGTAVTPATAYYTRAGSFRTDSSGLGLVNPDGYKVLDTAGKPIVFSAQDSGGTMNFQKVVGIDSTGVISLLYADANGNSATLTYGGAGVAPNAAVAAVAAIPAIVGTGTVALPQFPAVAAVTAVAASAAVKIAEVNIPNPQGMDKQGGTLFKLTAASGTPAALTAANGTSEQLLSNNLELSNVDMASEFVNMITTQRAYSANSKTITTADQMTQEVLALIR